MLCIISRKSHRRGREERSLNRVTLLQDTHLADHIETLWGASALACVTAYVAWQKGFFSFPFSEKKGSEISIFEVIIAFVLFISVMAILVPLLSLLWLSVLGLSSVEKIMETGQVSGVFQLLAIVLSATVLISYITILGPSKRDTVWGKSQNMPWDIALGSMTWLICFPLVIVLQQLIEIILQWAGISFPKNEQVAVEYLKMTTEFPWLFVSLAFLLILIVPVIEEILFRGFLQNWLKQKLGRGLAIFIASLIFAMFHFSISQGITNIELLAALFVLSCFLGFVYERQQSLWAPIGLHATFNAISIGAILLTLSQETV